MRGKWGSWLLRPVLAAALAAASLAVCAANRALLVGVSEYPHLPGRRLDGPVNDVRLMRHLLMRLGMADHDVRELSEAAGPADWPTRARVLGAIDQLVRDSRAGDWVVLYFSGHGSQLPQSPATRRNWPEPDGYDEVFLTRDTAHWDMARREVVGGIVDDEFAAAIERLRSRGVRVWAIFDTCHADGMTRSSLPAADSDVQVTRFVNALEFGTMPGARWAHVRPRPAQSSGRSSWRTAASAPPVRSGAADSARPAPVAATQVAFFASRADEPAAEETFDDPLQPQLRRRYGVFTYQLARAGAAWHGSFAALADAIERSYQGRAFPRPQFSGALDAVPPFSSPAPGVGR